MSPSPARGRLWGRSPCCASGSCGRQDAIPLALEPPETTEPDPRWHSHRKQARPVLGTHTQSPHLSVEQGRCESYPACHTDSRQGRRTPWAGRYLGEPPHLPHPLERGCTLWHMPGADADSDSLTPLARAWSFEPWALGKLVAKPWRDAGRCLGTCSWSPRHILTASVSRSAEWEEGRVLGTDGI